MAVPYVVSLWLICRTTGAYWTRKSPKLPCPRNTGTCWCRFFAKTVIRWGPWFKLYNDKQAGDFDKRHFIRNTLQACLHIAYCVEHWSVIDGGAALFTWDTYDMISCCEPDGLDPHVSAWPINNTWLLLNYIQVYLKMTCTTNILRCDQLGHQIMGRRV